MVRRVHNGLLRMFFMVAEPRVERILQFVIYVFQAMLGIFLIVNPPATFENVLGDFGVAAFAWSLGCGGVAAGFAVLPGIWWLERLGILCLWTGMGMFCVIVVALGVSPTGFMISACFSASLAIRWIGIRRYQLAPRRD